MKRALVVLLAVLVTPLSPASAAPLSISGTVVSGVDGAPLADVCVSAYTDPYLPGTYGFGTTAEDGTYRLSAIAGRYVVEFWDCADDGTEHMSEYYEDASDPSEATRIVVTPAGVESVDASLEVAGSIEGRVTDTRGGPLRDVCVDASRTAGGSYGSVASADDGTFVLSGLRPGQYRVMFGGSCTGVYENEFYDDAPTWEDADLVEVLPGQTTASIDAVLTRQPGTGSGYEGLTGLVADLDGAPASYGACVDAHRFDGDDWTFAGSAWTGEDGRYRLAVAPGQYALFARGCGANLIGEWYEDAGSIWEANLVEVTEEVFTTVDFALSPFPVADLGVEIVRIENIPVVTDAGPSPVQPGTRRRIHLRFTNDSDAGTDMYGSLRVCPVTAGRCDGFGLGEWLLPGATHRVIEWNATVVGDVRLDASIWADGVVDHNWDNDSDTADHYAVVGGTGVGVGRPI